jgi:hypothetical protein
LGAGAGARIFIGLGSQEAPVLAVNPAMDGDKERTVKAAPPVYCRDPALETFLKALAARRLSLTNNDTLLARAMLGAGFSPAETEAFLRRSEWAVYYRNCVSACHLPESQTILDALRRAFDSGATTEQAGSAAVEALRGRPQPP